VPVVPATCKAEAKRISWAQEFETRLGNSYLKKKKRTGFGKNVEKLKPSQTTSGDVIKC
jgi:hypothetical protein